MSIKPYINTKIFTWCQGGEKDFEHPGNMKRYQQHISLKEKVVNVIDLTNWFVGDVESFYGFMFSWVIPSGPDRFYGSYEEVEQLT